MLQALGHNAVHVKDTLLDGETDGQLVRRLHVVECDWLFSLDLHRQPEVWTDVYTAVGDEGNGRLLRLVPQRKSGVGGTQLVAYLTSYLVHRFDKWERWLQDDAIRMIEVGRRALGQSRGRMHYSAYTGTEVVKLTQQGVFDSGGPRTRKVAAPRRGR